MWVKLNILTPKTHIVGAKNALLTKFCGETSNGATCMWASRRDQKGKERNILCKLAIRPDHLRHRIEIQLYVWVDLLG